MDTVANCIEERFNQKDYIVYANCAHILLKGTSGNLSHKMSTNHVSSTELDSDTLRIQLSILAESYHSFRKDEGVGDTLHNVIDLVPHIRGHVLGQDYSGYASYKCQL